MYGIIFSLTSNAQDPEMSLMMFEGWGGYESGSIESGAAGLQNSI